jgi:hypothetical protein
MTMRNLYNILYQAILYVRTTFNVCYKTKSSNRRVCTQTHPVHGNISFLVVLIEAVEGITHQQAAGTSRTVMSVNQQEYSG